ncbi:hypothetical protein Asp14428_19490 [Actinoplanes sp. NBRC 14428]|nr:hypothetical protein Asp14428_19490 [Actinoplanes sp. NBRC 14428]
MRAPAGRAAERGTATRDLSRDPPLTVGERMLPLSGPATVRSYASTLLDGSWKLPASGLVRGKTLR